MPTSDHYEGELSDRLRRLAEHHYGRETRHISLFEYSMLIEAADRLDSSRFGPAGEPALRDLVGTALLPQARHRRNIRLYARPPSRREIGR